MFVSLFFPTQTVNFVVLLFWMFSAHLVVMRRSHSCFEASIKRPSDVSLRSAGWTISLQCHVRRN